MVGGSAIPAGLASALGMSEGRDPPLADYVPYSPPLSPTSSPSDPLPTAADAPHASPAAIPQVLPTVTPSSVRKPTTTTPKPAPRSASKPAAPAPALGPAAQVVDLTNQQRASNGCGALRVDARITAAAQKHSADMSANDYFSHDSQDGRTFDQRIRAEGYPSPGAENIAAGQPTAAAVVDDWMNSPGHRRNILDCSLSTIGVGYVADGDYWTQDFGR